MYPLSLTGTAKKTKVGSSWRRDMVIIVDGMPDYLELHAASIQLLFVISEHKQQ